MSLYNIGSQGDSVKQIQTYLKNAGFDPGGIDGIYGNNTKSAVTAYQKAKGLAVDGIVGPQTMGSFAPPAASVAAPVAAASTVQPAASPAQAVSAAADPTFNVPNFNYKSPVDDTLTKLIAEMMGRQFNYNPASDPSLQLAINNMSQNVMEQMNSRGILNSTVTRDGVTQGTNDLQAQFYDKAYERYMQEGQQLTNNMNALLQMDEKSFRDYKAAYDSKYDQAKSQYDIAVAKIERQRNKVQDAWARVEEIGYVDNEASIALGVKAGTASKSAREAKEKRLQQLEDQKTEHKNRLNEISAQHSNAVALENLRTKNDLTLKGGVEEKGNKQQVDAYYQLRDIYMGGGHGEYSGDPKKAYDWLTSHYKGTVSQVGNALYNQLLSDVTGAMNNDKKFNGIDTKVTGTVDDHLAQIKKLFIMVDPGTKEVVRDMDGIAKYIENLEAAGADETMIDNLLLLNGLPLGK